jgi:site-specific recombinase XerD
LRSGQSLKTIGDLLGHRNAESTCVYLRLATDDLREVALSFPGAPVRTAQGKAR